MASRTLTVRGVPDAGLRRLRARAAANHRSLNGELLVILEAAARETRASEATIPMIRESPPPSYSTKTESSASLLDTLDHKALAAICRRHGIQWLALFGSHARGAARPDSDVDLVVDFAPGKTPGLGIVKVAEALGTAMGDRRVDLVTRRGLPSRIRERVLASARPLYAEG